MNKKGIIFTLISILVVTLLVVSFSSQSYVTLKDRVPVTNSRFNIANNYVIDLKESYLERALYVNSIRSLFALVMRVNQSGYFSNYDELNVMFKEVLVSGTINGVNVDEALGMQIFGRNNFTERLASIENASYSLLRINTSFDKRFDGLSVVVFQSNQSGPWRIGVNLTINFTVDAGLFAWNSTDVVTTYFSLEGFEDPLYFMNTNPQRTSKVRETNFSSWNVTNLYYHIANRTYNAEPRAPNYLSRLYNDYSPSDCCGIENPVNPTYLGISTDTPKTFAEWCFWSSRCGPDDGSALWYINGISASSPYGPNFNFFKLDTYHLSTYNVTENAVPYSPP